MTQTTNIGLKKIDGSENWRQIFDYHNDSADKTDSAVSAVQDGIAIVANGDTHAAVEEGQFVYVRNHSTLAEGLYKAASAIGTNGELTTSNLTADSSGGLNDLQEQITALNSKTGTEAQIGSTYNLGNNCICLCQYGWNGLQATGRITIGARDDNFNHVFFPNGTYEIVIRNNSCKGKKTDSSSLTDLTSKVSSISYSPVYKQITFTFSSAPFGTSDSIIIIELDASIKRTA